MCRCAWGGGSGSGSRMLVMMVAIVYKVMVMIVVMDLRAMVKVCADVYLIYSFPVWYLKHGCECSHGYPNPIKILI
jgi:hypothetical protein